MTDEEIEALAGEYGLLDGPHGVYEVVRFAREYAARIEASRQNASGMGLMEDERRPIGRPR